MVSTLYGDFAWRPHQSVGSKSVIRANDIEAFAQLSVNLSRLARPSESSSDMVNQTCTRVRHKSIKLAKCCDVRQRASKRSIYVNNFLNEIIGAAEPMQASNRFHKRKKCVVAWIATQSLTIIESSYKIAAGTCMLAISLAFWLGACERNCWLWLRRVHKSLRMHFLY